MQDSKSRCWAAAAALSPAAVADLCEEFVGRGTDWPHVGRAITSFPQTHKGTASPAGFGELSPEEYQERLDQYQEQFRSEEVWLREHGAVLAVALGLHDCASSAVLSFLHRVAEGPSAVRATWEDTKVALQAASIRLLKGTPPEAPKGKAKPSTVQRKAMLDATAGKLLFLKGKPIVLTRGEKDVLTLLVEMGTASLKDLEQQHGRPDRVLSRLLVKYAKLKQFTSLPGGGGRVVTRQRSNRWKRSEAASQNWPQVSRNCP